MCCVVLCCSVLIATAVTAVDILDLSPSSNVQIHTLQNSSCAAVDCDCKYKECKCKCTCSLEGRQIPSFLFLSFLSFSFLFFSFLFFSFLFFSLIEDDMINHLEQQASTVK